MLKLNLSFSRVDKWVRCPKAYRYRYLDRLKEPSTGALDFGKAVHAALEAYTLGRPLGEFEEFAANAGIRDHRQIDELGALVTKAKRHIDGRDVIGVERAFDVALGDSGPAARLALVGFIDRIDSLDSETVEVVDYKTNQALMSRKEADDSLQMEVYNLAVRQLYPWAKTVKLTFHLLRHDVLISVMKTAEDAERTKRFLLATGKRLLALHDGQDIATPAELSTLCGWCGYRSRCQAYQAVLDGGEPVAWADLEEPEALASQREDIAARIKILDGRKRELDGAIKQRLELEPDGQWTAGGRTYRLSTSTKRIFPPMETAQAISERTGALLGDVFDQYATFSTTKLGKLTKEDKELREVLDCLADKVPYQRLVSSKVKSS
jgi:RecB family exonuclease